jgi:hypothetical protein
MGAELGSCGAPGGPAATSSDLLGGRRWPGTGHPRRADGFTS